MFEYNAFPFLNMFLCFVFPALTSYFIIKRDDWWSSFFVTSLIPYVFRLHCTWLVNSASHLWGTRSHTKNIFPADNILVSFLTMGEGWHNYHHTYPYDYSAGYTISICELFPFLSFWLNWCTHKSKSQNFFSRNYGRFFLIMFTYMNYIVNFLLNETKFFIDLMAWFGLARDLKQKQKVNKVKHFIRFLQALKKHRS